jgi:hypothetical protein
MMVGNHDYDLACDPAFAVKLNAYNIQLDTSLNLIRAFGDKKDLDRTRTAARLVQCFS